MPYGETRFGNTGPTDFGFTSQRQEAGFGLYDYNARYYSSVLGRFISPDTIVPEPGGSQGFNRYAYVNNNPVKYVDPSGNCGETYSGNTDLNASTNQQCYNLAEKFTNELADTGRVPLRDDGTTANLSDYNLNVLKALYGAWQGSYGLSQPVLPSSEKLPLGQAGQLHLLC